MSEEHTTIQPELILARSLRGDERRQGLPTMRIGLCFQTTCLIGDTQPHFWDGGRGDQVGTGWGRLEKHHHAPWAEREGKRRETGIRGSHESIYTGVS